MQRAQEQQADLAELIASIRTSLTSDDNASAYFASEVEWLDRREALWQSDAFRVGLIGITSSGKSTLVNALLGAELLPEAVRPSSNSLVVCEWGERLQCVIHYQDPGRKPTAVPASAIANRLRKYGDEATNPGNEKDVREIRLRSPHFKLGRGVTLVDTPGLDAFNHDAHESLTLDVLLPTVDMVAFVTTCKANSDAKMSGYVSMAKAHGKPIIVVQNMMDSVEDKQGVRGEILKTRDEVLAEHRRRVETVLLKAGVSSLLISQVSAIWALRHKDKASGVPEFVAAVQDTLQDLAPGVAAGRRTQLDTWLRALVAEEMQPGDPSAIYRKQAAQARRRTAQLDEFDARYKQMKADAEDCPGDFAIQGEALLAQADALTNMAVDEAAQLQTSVEQWRKQSTSRLSAMNKRVHKQITEDRETLNLRADDFDPDTQLARPTSSVSFDTTRRERRVRTEQSGGWGSFKRAIDLFGQNWGYDERTESWTEIANVDAFRKSVRTAIRKEHQYVEPFVTAMVERVETARKQFRKEIRAQLRSVTDKMAAQEGLIERNRIAHELETLLARPRKMSRSVAKTAHAKQVTATPAVAQSLHEVDVGSMELALTQLAKVIAQHRFIDIRSQILYQQAFRRIHGERRVLIAGFDSDSVAEFVNRFWFDMVEADPLKKITFDKCRIENGCVNQIATAVLGDDARIGAWNAMSRYMTEPCVVFLLLDVQQIGSTESVLDRADIPFDLSIHPIVAVVESMRALQNSGAAGEALLELRALAKRRKLRLAGALVNDEKAWFSTLANKLITMRGPFATLADENEFILSMPEESRVEAGNIVRAWRAPATA
jgi:GTPase SAR1 family protein